MEEKQFPGMEDSMPSGDMQRCTINAVFKDCNLKAKKESEVYKLVLEVDREHVAIEDRMALNELVGKDVSVRIASVEYGQYLNARAEGMEAAKKRAERTDRQERMDAGEQDGTILPTIELLEIGDFKDADGNRFTVKPFDEGYIIEGIGDDEKIAELDMPDETFETATATRQALKEFASKRGYTMVAPEGFMEVYRGLKGGAGCCVYVAWNPLSKTFQGYVANASEDTGFIQELAKDRKEIGPARDDLADWVRKKDLCVIGYTQMASAPESTYVMDPDDGFDPEQEAKAASAMIYEDAEGNHYYVTPENDEQPDVCAWWIAKREVNGDEKLADLDCETPFQTQEEAQTALDTHAAVQGWFAKPVTELLAEAEADSQAEDLGESDPASVDAEVAADEEPAPEPQDEGSEQEVEESDTDPFIEGESRFDSVQPDDYVVNKMDPKNAKIKVLGKDEAEGSVKLFGKGSFMRDDFDKNWRRPETQEEPTAEPEQEPEPVTEEAPAEAPTEESGDSTFDQVVAMMDAGDDKPKLYHKDGFRATGTVKSPINIIMLARDADGKATGIKLLGHGLRPAEIIDEQYGIWEG